MKQFFRALIKAYSYIISPLLGSNCRYYPTCSAYADEAFKRHGALKGFILSVLRISRCHPWSRHPLTDPVPECFTWSEVLGYKRTLKNPEQKPEKQKNEATRVNDES